MPKDLKQTKRAEIGRGLFCSRDSGGDHQQTPSQYVKWAKAEADKLGVTFSGTPTGIDKLRASGKPFDGDLFFDSCISGDVLSRPAINAMKEEIRRDKNVSHVFIPRRDRLARPDNATDGVRLENELRQMGVTLVFMDCVLSPLRKGQRQNVGEALTSFIAYDSSGRFRDELASKMLDAQINLAESGYTTGGRAPYGFRRNLISPKGEVVRELQEGEIVRQKGYHVVWLPGPDEELDVNKRIIQMIETIPACRIARILTEEGVKSPDYGRSRKDNGVEHLVSGVWHATTIMNIVRNPLLRATTSYGRRSMGNRRRLSSERRPREMVDDDFRSDGKPKVIQNDESVRIIAKAHCEPVVPLETMERVLKIVDKRGETQRGKPRSRDPEQNPLGGRVTDLACTWPMYGLRTSGSFQYKCGYYQQSHGAKCEHNHIDGTSATKFALAAIRQRLLSPEMIHRLEEKLRERAGEGSRTNNGSNSQAAKCREEIRLLEKQLDAAKRNLAFASTRESFATVETVIAETEKLREKVVEALARLERTQSVQANPDEMVKSALNTLRELPKLASDPAKLGLIGELFQKVDLQLYLRFEPVQKKKRKINQLNGGVVTIGNAPAPIEKYSGPTGRRALQGQKNKRKTPATDSSTAGECPTDSDRSAKSLGNANRADRI